MQAYLDFEKPISDLEGKIRELQTLNNSDDDVNVESEIARLKEKSEKSLKDIYSRLDPWQKTQVARHPDRPHFKDYVDAFITDFHPLAGDRTFGEDAAIQGGFGRFNGQSIAVIGHEKGHDTQSRLKHNFGMASPEGYRKAVRIMELADRFAVPVLTLVDTAGAYPGIGAEERGQAQAIACSTRACINLTQPLVSVIIGEGGSGGAIAIATGNKVLMLEHSIYSVISPEGAASILWRDSTRAKEAAIAMKITAEDLIEFNIIDTIIPEPMGGAHRERQLVLENTRKHIESAFKELENMTPAQLKQQRQEKFLAIGRMTNPEVASQKSEEKVKSE